MLTVYTEFAAFKSIGVEKSYVLCRVEWNGGRVTWTEGGAEGLVSNPVLLHVLDGSGAVSECEVGGGGGWGVGGVG